MKKVLLNQIIIALIIVFLILSAIALLIFSLDSKRTTDDNLKRNIDHTLRFIEKAYKLPLWNFDLREIEELSEGLLQQDIFVAVNVYNEYEFSMGMVKENYKEKRIIHQTQRVDTPYQLRINQDDIHSRTLDIFFDRRRIGHLEIFYTDYFAFREQVSRAVELALMLFVYTFITIMIIYFIISKKFLSPVFKLVEFVVKVAETHDFTLKTTYNKENEIKLMYNGFNYLLNSILKRDRDRDLLESELSKTRNYLQSILQAMPSILFALDNNNKITLWNKAAKNYTGISEKEILGQPFSLVEKYFNNMQIHINIVRMNKSIVYLSSQYFNDQFIVDVFLYPLMVDNEMSIVVRIDDVTEIKKKETQLIQAQKMETVGTLAGGLAHDFNNILNGIVGTLSIMKHKFHKDKIIEPERMASYMEILDNSSNRATDLVQQLLSLSRKQDIDFSAIDLNIALRNVIKICQNTFDRKIVINSSFADQKAIVWGSLSHIEQILLNLCINAYHAMTMMRKVSSDKENVLSLALDYIKTDPIFIGQHQEATEEFYWKIQIGDTGVGMNQSVLSKIFEPFFTTKGKDKGTGLGLTMVYNIVKEHKGFIDVYSEIDLGTTFHLYFPVFAQDPVVEIVKESDKVFADRGLVLIIDDEPLVRNTAKEMLEIIGYNVEMAVDGDNGIERYFELKDQIKFVILDMIMPKKSGKEVFYVIKEDNPDVKVILASGFKQDERVDEVLQAGATAFIQKPFTLDKLILTIKNNINI
ncbi:MAG: response regulator [Candidatus Cloacimonetes bacterium]|nr:response regulator [Candidatus Cloacimonadota bacterium]